MYARVEASWTKFDKYYSLTDSSVLYVAALVLHPGCRTAYIKSNWEKGWQKTALAKVEELWKQHYRDRPSPYDIIPESYDSQLTEGDSFQSDLEAYDEYERELTKYSRPTSKDEYIDYISLPPLKLGRKTTALSWWMEEEQRLRWPRLAYMAIDILSIPAMSAEAERVFSGARRTISWDRAQLLPSTIEHTECCKHWELSGITQEAS